MFVLSLHIEDKPVLVRNVNGTHTRVRTSVIHDDGKHCTFTRLPQQVCWVFKPGQEPRLLLGEECMMFQGFPVNLVSVLAAKSPSSVLHDIVGEPCVQSSVIVFTAEISNVNINSFYRVMVIPYQAPPPNLFTCKITDLTEL